MTFGFYPIDDKHYKRVMSEHSSKGKRLNFTGLIKQAHKSEGLEVYEVASKRHGH